MPIIYTIGHSNIEWINFIDLLKQHKVMAIADVRSHPYSKFFPQYSKEYLKNSLTSNGIKYVFLGQELGARSQNPYCYRDYKVQYDLLEKEPLFEEGIKRIIKGTDKYKIALLCSEKDPIECHRALLVSRNLFNRGIQIAHIHTDGSLETQQSLETRLLVLCKLPEGDMFKGKEQFVIDAYKIQSDRVAYRKESVGEAEKEMIE